MKIKAFSALALSICTTAALAGDVKITNSSDWALQNFYMSPVDTTEWGPDQLGEDIIATGESFTLKNVPCASFDVKLVDEDGDECVVPAVDVCGSGGWNIGNDDLLACQAESK